MKKILFIILLIFPVIVFAHPGRTASDGCHYCRTNCDSWGVVWNQRHCHNNSPTQENNNENKINWWFWGIASGGSYLWYLNKK